MRRWINPSWLLPFAEPAATRWVRSQRNRYRTGRNSRALTDTERAAFASFFRPEILGKVRIVEADRLENPWFFRTVRWFGIRPPIDMSHAGGVALDDTILIVGQDSSRFGRDQLSVLFHEMVHVAQYAELGVNEFIRRYVRGYLNAGMDYRAIPFERQAYELQERFDSAPHQSFSVGEEVRRLTVRLK